MLGSRLILLSMISPKYLYWLVISRCICPIFGGMYRRPGSNPNSFIEILNDKLLNIKQTNKYCIYAGDFNLDLLKYQSHNPTSDFINLNFAYSVTPIITKPTRITSHSATLIDNIFTNSPNQNDNIAAIIPIDISDHFPIFYIAHNNLLHNQNKPKVQRDYNDRNAAEFKRRLTQTDWSTLLSSQDAQESYTYLHDTIADES